MVLVGGHPERLSGTALASASRTIARVLMPEVDVASMCAVPGWIGELVGGGGARPLTGPARRQTIMGRVLPLQFDVDIEV